MDWEALFVGVLLIATFVSFAREWIPVELTALAALLLLAFSKILSPGEALAGFANPAIIAIASLFILSAALVRTGIVKSLGQAIVRLSGRSEPMALALLLVSIAGLSAFINNTPVVVVFLPVTLGVAEALRVSPSRLLLPMAFAGTLGGMMTLVGTSTNVLLATEWQAVLRSGTPGMLGERPLEMFDFFPLGVIVLGAGLIYLFLFGRRLLPDRITLALGKLPTEYLTEIQVPKDSPLNGKTLHQAGLIADSSVRVLQWIRGEEIEYPPFETRDSLQAGDTLLVRGGAEKILALLEKKNFELIPELRPESGQIITSGMRLAEIVMTPDSQLIGQRVEQAGLRRNHRLSLIAIQRKGIHMRKSLSQLILRVGDVLLVQGSEQAIQELGKHPDFMFLEGTHERVPLRYKAPLTLLITVGFVLALTLTNAPLEFLALAAAGLVVLSGCLTLQEAYKAVDWSVILLIVGTLALGNAMVKTGLAEWIAHDMILLLSPMGPYALLAGTYLLTNTLSHFLSNNASALIMLPIALALAGEAGVSAMPFVMAVAFGATLAFAVPTGYQTYMLVYGPGGYRFGDYVRVGLPLDLLAMAICTIFLPLFWPLTP